MQVNKPLLEKMQTPPTSAIAVRVEAEIDEDDELRAIEAAAAVAMARYRPRHGRSTRVCASAARRCRFARTTAVASAVQHRTGLYRPLGWLLAMARGASSYDRQSEYAANRAEASDAESAHQTTRKEDAVLLEVGADARCSHRLVHQPLRVRTRRIEHSSFYMDKHTSSTSPSVLSHLITHTFYLSSVATDKTRCFESSALWIKRL